MCDPISSSTKSLLCSVALSDLLWFSHMPSLHADRFPVLTTKAVWRESLSSSVADCNLSAMKVVQEHVSPESTSDTETLCQCCESIPVRLSDVLQLDKIQDHAQETGNADRLRHFLVELSALVLGLSDMDTMVAQLEDSFTFDEDHGTVDDTSVAQFANLCLLIVVSVGHAGMYVSVTRIPH